MLILFLLLQHRAPASIPACPQLTASHAPRMYRPHPRAVPPIPLPTFSLWRVLPSLSTLSSPFAHGSPLSLASFEMQGPSLLTFLFQLWLCAGMTACLPPPLSFRCSENLRSATLPGSFSSLALECSKVCSPGCNGPQLRACWV